MPSRDNLEAWDGGREKEVSLRCKRFIGCIKKFCFLRQVPRCTNFWSWKWNTSWWILVFVKRQCRFALLAKEGFKLQPMQYTFTVTLSRGYIPDICTNVKFYKRRPMKGLLNVHEWQTITNNMALPSLWQRLSLKNVHSCSRRYFRSYTQYYCKWKMCITNYCLTFCYSGGVHEN